MQSILLKDQSLHQALSHQAERHSVTELLFAALSAAWTLKPVHAHAHICAIGGTSKLFYDPLNL